MFPQLYVFCWQPHAPSVTIYLLSVSFLLTISIMSPAIPADICILHHHSSAVCIISGESRHLTLLSTQIQDQFVSFCCWQPTSATSAVIHQVLVSFLLTVEIHPKCHHSCTLVFSVDSRQTCRDHPLCCLPRVLLSVSCWNPQRPPPQSPLL